MEGVSGALQSHLLLKRGCSVKSSLVSKTSKGTDGAALVGSLFHGLCLIFPYLQHESLHPLYPILLPVCGAWIHLPNGLQGPPGCRLALQPLFLQAGQSQLTSLSSQGKCCSPWPPWWPPLGLLWLNDALLLLGGPKLAPVIAEAE